MTRTLYLDLVGGAAGDMLLAALLDLGASLSKVQANLHLLGLDRVELHTKDVHPAGLRALQLDVTIDGRLGDSGVQEGSPKAVLPGVGPIAFKSGHDHGHRPYRVIRAMLATAPLPEPVRRVAAQAFLRLAEAESAAHGIPLEEVVFHEVGADDAIADIVGVATALDELQIEEVVVSPVPLGRGLTRGAHGPIPLPGPAVLHLLSGVPTVGVALDGETVTPTGAALLVAIATRYGQNPGLIIERVGTGAGHKTWPDRPNVVRAWLGQQATRNVVPVEEDVVVEANLDDMSPEQLPGLERALFAAGAVDVWAQPIHMKKGRMGMLVSALGRAALEAALVQAFLVHSTTLGVRVQPVRRHRTDRRVLEVQTPFGPVRVKAADRPGGPRLYAPEHEDCDRLAQAAGQPLRAVYEAALRAVWVLDAER